MAFKIIIAAVHEVDKRKLRRNHRYKVQYDINALNLKYKAQNTRMDDK